MFKENKGKKLVFGMIHLLPMPSTPFYTEGNIQKSLDKALRDAEALQKGGASGCLIQTSDKIYTKDDDTDYCRVATMAMIAGRVKSIVDPDFKIGVQLMINCITPSLAVAKAVNADFIRCSVLIGESKTSVGHIEADPYKVLQYRNLINAHGIDMISEALSVHFKSEYDKTSLQMRAKRAIGVGAAAIEVASDDATMNEQLIQDIKEIGDIPVVLGGRTNLENCKERMKYADGVFVGRCFENNNWGGNVDPSIVKEYMDKIHEIE